MQFLKYLTEQQPTLITDLETTVKIVNAPYMPLTVENIGPGPRGLPALSICHYGIQNGDLMRDPEMCFEVEVDDGRVREFHPYYFRNDYAGIEQNAVNPDTRRIDRAMIRTMDEFAVEWSRNLITQGFRDAYQLHR